MLVIERLCNPNPDMPEEKNLHHPGLMPACPGRTVQGAGKGHEGAQGSHVCLRLSAGKEEQNKN